MRRELGIIGCIVALLVGGFGFVTPGFAASFTVNTTADTVDANPGNGVCRDANNKCSLRAAIMEANNKAGADTITLPAGTYKLTRVGTDEDAGGKGDLDVTSGPLAITGVSAATTIVDGTVKDRVFDVRNGASLTLAKLSVQNGKGGASQDDGGGGIRATGGASLTLSSVTVQKNTSTYYGAGILFNHLVFERPTPAKLTIVGATITHNIADRIGGGIALGGGSTLDLRTTRVISNTARGLYNSSITQYGGGGLYMASGFTPIGGDPLQTTAILNNATFDDNLARGQFAGDGWGGAVFNDGLSSLTITDGTYIRNRSYGHGGAIYSSGRLKISAASFAKNQALGGGGAVEATGPAGTTITNSTFAQNHALGDGEGGGAIDMFGPFTFKNLTIRLNSAAIGGGLRFTGSVGTLEQTNISDNEASSDGGGIAGAPGARGSLVTVLNSVVDGNTAEINGGGIFNAGEMVVTGSSATNNTAVEGNGGGIYNYQSFAFTATNVKVTGNVAGNAGGGVFTRHNTFGSNGDDPKTPVLTGMLISMNRATQGGGLENDMSVKLVNSAVVSNTAIYGAGIFNAQRSNASDYPRSLDLSNVTISGNTASDSAGGIYNSMGTAYVNSSTIASNSVRVGTTGPVTGEGGGIFNDPAQTPKIVVSNTIIANNAASTGPDCRGKLVSANYNLIRILTGCSVSGSTTNNKTGNPLLKVLANNGGNTLTHALQGTSPARNAGSPNAFGSSTTSCPKTDQRVVNRVVRCDMGAYEIAP